MPFDESILEDIPETQSGFDESLLEDIPDEQSVVSESASLQPVTSIPVQEQPSLDQRILDVEQWRIPPTKELIAEVAARNAQRGSESIVSIPPALVQALSGPITQGSLLAGEKLGIVPSDTRAKMAETIAGGVSPTPDMYLDAPAYITPVLGETLMAYQGGKALKSSISNLAQGNIGEGLGEGALAGLAFLPGAARVGKTVKGFNRLSQPIPTETTTAGMNRPAPPVLANPLEIRPTIQPSSELVTPKSGLKVELTQEQLVKADKIINRKYPKGATPSQIEEVLNAIRNEKPRVISNLANQKIVPPSIPEQPLGNLRMAGDQLLEAQVPVDAPKLNPLVNIRIVGSPLLESQIPKAEAMLAASMREAELYPARRDFPKALAEKVSQEQAQAAAAAEARTIQPNKPLTENQIRIVQDSLKKQIENNRLKEERSGVIAGTRLEKWADDILKGGAMHLGPDVLAAYAVKGAALYEKGFTTSAQWTGEMVKAFGNEVIPHLPMLFKEAQTLRMAAFQPKDTNALQERPATQVLQDVREQPGQVKQALPAEASPEGIRSGQQAQAAGTPNLPLEGPIPIPPPAKGVVAQKFGEFADYLAGKKQGPDVEPVLQNKSLPDFNEHSVNKQMLSQPYAMERVPILGALFGGMRRLKGSVPESVVTYFGERGIGRSIASALAQEYRYLDDVFKIKDGQITNIGQTKPGQSLFMADVFEALQENPNAYKLSPEQQVAFGKMMELETEFNNLQNKHKIGNVVDAESGEIINPNEIKKSYFPRIVTKRPASSEGTLKKGQAVGGKAFFEKSRMFDTEMEGWLKGYRYEDSIARRLGTRAERLYKRIADKRLIEDPSLGGVTRKELVRDLEMKYAEELASGEMTPDRIQQIADSIESQRSTGIPAFRHKIFDAKTAKQLQKLFPVSASPIRSGLAAINNAIKALWLGFDFGVGLIQGQTLMFNRPKVWLNAWKGSLQAMANPRYFSEYVKKNIEPVRELAQLGSSVGRMEEMMSGMESGELIHTIPGLKAVGAVAKPFARQFQTFLDTAKIEMWKGLREVTPKSEWPRVVQTIESTLSSARMEAIGISRNRALTERVFLMAPSYYRGAAQMIGAMAEKGVSGQVARRSLTAYMIGGAVLYYGFAKMLGMKEDEIIKRMDPRRSDFMMWRIKNGERNTEVGLGGIYRSLIKLMGNMYKTSVENPGNWASMTSDKNPIIKWYRGHSGPIVGTGWDLMTGKDFMGKESALNFGLAKKLFPMVIGAMMNTDQKFSPIDVGVTFMGGTAFERPNEMQQEVGRLSSKFLKSKGIEKPQFTFKEDQATYGNMFNALRNGKDERAVEIYKELSKTRKSYEIDSHLKELIDRPFTGSKKLEREFYETLNKQEQDYYQLALAERRDEVLKLVKLITEQSK